MSSHLKESLICPSLDLLNRTIDHNKDHAVILGSYETWHVPVLLKITSSVIANVGNQIIFKCSCELVLFHSCGR